MSSKRRSTRIRSNQPNVVEIGDLLEDYQETFKPNTRSRSALALSPQSMTNEDTDEDDNVLFSQSSTEDNEIVPRYNTRPKSRTTSSTVDSLEIANNDKANSIGKDQCVSDSNDSSIGNISEEYKNNDVDTSDDYKELSSREDDEYNIKNYPKLKRSRKNTTQKSNHNLTSIKTRSKSSKTAKVTKSCRTKNSTKSLKLIIKKDSNALYTTVKQPEAIPDTKNISTSTIKQKLNPTTKKTNRKFNNDNNANTTKSLNNKKRGRAEADEVIVLKNKKNRQSPPSPSPPPPPPVIDLHESTTIFEEKRQLRIKIPVIYKENTIEDIPTSSPTNSEIIMTDEEFEQEQVKQDPPNDDVDNNNEFEDLLRWITKDPILSKFQLSKDNLIVNEDILGEGQDGIVYMGSYNSLPVACKTRRKSVDKEAFYLKILRELTFAFKFSNCKYINKYIGWVLCNKNDVEIKTHKKNEKELFVLQQYVSNGDARSYLYQRSSNFQPTEVLQAAICLFSALSDTHKLDAGIVDLKLENYLIDSSGTGFLTDFGSCIDFIGRESVNLTEEEVSWTTAVAAPEMISKREFSKASDVFMGALILAELMTKELTDAEFRKKVLRRKNNGSVNFTPDAIKKEFKVFFDILNKGLQNDPLNRPTADEMLNSLKKIQSINTPLAD